MLIQALLKTEVEKKMIQILNNGGFSNWISKNILEMSEDPAHSTITTFSGPKWNTGPPAPPGL